MNRSDILEKLKKYREENAQKYAISKLGLFGSYSREESGDDSDIDIVIETNEPDIFKIVHIKADLEKLLHSKIDIVRKREKMNPYLKKRIERDAIYV